MRYPVRREVMVAAGVAFGEVVVADEVRRPGEAPVGCPAAPLLEGRLRRRGVRTRRQPVQISEGAGCGDATGLLTVCYEHAGRLVGFGAAAAAADPSAVAVMRGVVDEWSAVVRARRVLLAVPQSFCAGVERAIQVVEQALAQRGGPVFVRKQVVHNTHVVRDLERRGAVFVDELDQAPDGATVVFSAHGVSPAVWAEASRRGLDVIDATCPLVTKVHAEARRFAERGDTVVLIGHAGHEETEGTLGEAPDRTVLVESAADVAGLEVDDPGRVSYLTQTTLAVDEAEGVVAALRARFPALRGPKSDDICYATTNRQDALRVVAAESDLVLVVGSANSSNSLRLVELAERQGTPASLIDDVTDIRPSMLAKAATVGLTAGASAPPRLVDEVIQALGGLGPLVVERRQVTTETVTFALPQKVRPS
ncbi:MAG: 4-hydroxy-3-methylbut-2-enyl diphosphate reductase [Egibacteraceae bacterium]